MTHHNSQLRQYQPKKTYFITCNVKDRLNFFKEELFCELFIAELDLVKELKQFKLHAFAINPDHFHLLLMPGEGYNISEIMHSLKRNFSRDINKIIFGLPMNEGDIPQCRRINSEDMDPRFQSVSKNFKNNFIDIKAKNKVERSCFQEFGVFNQFILKTKLNFNQKHPTHNLPKFRWQSSFHDHIIRDQKDYNHHLHYTTYNYLKHKLPSDWKYTSLNYLNMVDSRIEW